MIIFYNRITGKIIGTIAGRFNTPEELRMWIGDKKENDRIIAQWKATKIGVDKQGNKYEAEHQADHPQKELFPEFEAHSMSIYDYKIDPKTKLFVKLDR